MSDNTFLAFVSYVISVIGFTIVVYHLLTFKLDTVILYVSIGVSIISHLIYS